MTREPFAIDADALHAFADGQLSESERAAVERHLAANPDAAAEVANWQRQNDALDGIGFENLRRVFDENFRGHGRGIDRNEDEQQIGAAGNEHFINEELERP